MRIQHSIIIKASKLEVWNKTIDFNNWNKWNPNVEECHSNFILNAKVGDSFFLKQKGLPGINWVITNLTEGQVCSWESKIRGIKFKATHAEDPTMVA